MPRTRFSAAVLLAALLAASPAMAIVTVEGSVQPAGPSGTFGNLPEGTIDADGDGINDYINIGGNRVFSDGTRFDDPDGSLTGAVPWDDEALWVDYDTRQNILVGDAFSTGSLTINGGSALRYAHLVIGHASELSPFPTTLNFDPTDDPDRFDFITDLTTVQTGGGGSGTMIITGPGSIFNNDPNIIPREFQTDLNAVEFARGGGRFDNPIYDLAGELQSTVLIPGGINPTIRDDDDGYDVIVGLTGTGILQIDNGGRMEVQDDLMVAVGNETVGSVIVDGFGSSLSAFGRSRLDDSGLTVENDHSSFIGGRGAGSLTVQNFGRAEFRNGLAIGAPTGSALISETSTSAQGAGQGSGTVEITGNGSRMDVYATSGIAGLQTNSGENLALAIGSVRTGSIATPIDPALTANQNLQTGTLTIAADATVNVLFSQAYSTNLGDANAAVGPNGQVFLRDGNFLIGNRLIHDGDINGYGLIRARELETSISSVISGGDPNAQSGVPSDPLRIVLLGDGLPPAPLEPPALAHRGVIEGKVDMQISGDVANGGVIDISGELSARSLFMNNGALLRSNASISGPLRIRLSSDTQVTAGPPAVGVAPVALLNGGTIAGDIDLVTAGGIENGDPTGGGNGGSIRASGSIQSGTLLNNRYGEIRVGQGQSLSILATATTAILNPRVFQNGVNQAGAIANGPATPATFYQANLGTIRVDGGYLELGRAAGFVPTTNPLVTPHVELFRNARSVVDGAALGTMQLSDGEVRFRNGVYNTGVIAMTAGDNTISGQVVNAGEISYGGALFPGIILVSGNHTTATFEDLVVNDGFISIGPDNNVVNFLGDLINSGTIEVAENISSFGVSESAYLVVAGNVQINGGTVGFAFATGGSSAPVTAPLTAGFSTTLIDAGSLDPTSRFSALDLPTLATGEYWDVVYDTVENEVRLEIVASAAFGADFDGDGFVTMSDVNVWQRNAGITSGASIIQGDADGDGDVDLTDYGFLAQQLVAGVPVAVPSAAVPEPAAAAMAALLALAAATRRRG